MWLDNQRSGKGTFRYADGDVYIGEWKDDIQDGLGIYKFQNGDYYEGKYVQGERTGEGIFKYSNGDKYVGNFQNGEKMDMAHSIGPMETPIQDIGAMTVSMAKVSWSRKMAMYLRPISKKVCLMGK